MADATIAYLETRDLGRLEQRVTLRGKMSIAPGTRVPASLVRTTTGLYVVGAKSRDLGVAIDLIARDDFRYERGTLSDRLLIGEAELVVASGHRREARLAVGVARLRHAASGRAHDVRPSRHVAPVGPRERAFLDGFLEPDEVLLAWRETDHDAPVESRIAAGTTGVGYLFSSDRRIARVVISPLGDSRVEPLEGVRLSLDETLSGADLIAGRSRFKLARSDLGLWREILAAAELAPRARLRETARFNWLGREDPAALAACRAVLDRGVRTGDPLATAAAFMVSVDLAEPNPAAPDVDAVLPALVSQRVGGDALATLWSEWQFSPEAAMVLLDQLSQAGESAEPWALALHEKLHERLATLRRDERRLARADVELAEHLIAAGQRERARTLLEQRLAALPSEELEDLLPGSDADLTAGAGGQLLRIRVFELLAEARRTGAGPDVRALTELARLQPLVTARVQALAEVSDGDTRARAEEVLRVLGPGGLSRADGELLPAELATLSPDLLRDVLPHPVAREGSALVGKIQSLLAAVPAPDHRMLLEYVEPIRASRQPHATRALARAARVLDQSSVQGFVSRGKKGIGLRAYDGPPPFVLVGGRHLDDDPEYAMSPRELAFSIATEVAHLRYGHARVTSSEVWSGLFERSKEGLEVLLGVLPLFRGYRVAEKAYQLLQKVPTGTLKKVIGGANKVRKRLASRPDFGDEIHKSDDVLSAVHEDLVATARVMQLTADRAGLLVAGDLGSTLRAMLLVRPDHKDELARAEHDGIEAVLAERRPDGEMAHQDLAVRIAALISFYLSDDYFRLRAAAETPSP